MEESTPTTVDVSGLSPEAVRAVETYVAHLRKPADRSSGPRWLGEPGPTYEEFDRALKELASGPPVRSVPADWSRADLYDDHD